MSLISTVSAYITLTRPFNCAIALASVYVGAFVADGDVTALSVFFAGLSGWCLCAGANAMNDCYDIEVDRLNKPDRPLVTGNATRRVALGFSVLLMLLSIALSGLLTFPHVAIIIFAVLAATIYNIVSKKYIVLGNITVSTVAALMFLYGGLTGAAPLLALIPAAFALLFHFGREILKDIEDAGGDRLSRMSTVPVLYGPTAALTVMTGVFAVLIVVTILPVVMGLYGMMYLAVVGVVDIVIVYVIWSMWRNAGPVNAGKMSGILKVDMVIGLLAICLGR